MIKKVILSILFIVFILLIFYAYVDEHKDYFKNVEGDWQIEVLFHKKEDLKEKGYFIIGFERGNHSWIIVRENRESKFITSKCKFYNIQDTLKMAIFNCKDSRLNGDYNVYIDTIQKTEAQYLIRFSLDSEDTYIQAVRPKIRYYGNR